MKSRMRTELTGITEVAAVLLVAALVLGTAAAQQPAQNQNNQGASTTPAEKSERRVVMKVIEIKHINSLELSQLASLLHRGVEVQFSTALNVITLRGDPESVAEAEAVVKKLDVPRMKAIQPLGRNVEIIAHVIGAGDDGESELGSHESLERVVAELKKKFPYKRYQLLETVASRVRAGESASVAGHISNLSPADLPPTFYSLDVGVGDIELQEGRGIVGLSQLRFSARVPVVTSPPDSASRQFNYQDIHISTKIDVREGDTVVVGKTAVQGPVRSLFLVLTARLVE